MIIKLVLSLIVLSLSACSVISPQNVPVSGADFTVLNVSNQYLKSLISGEADVASRMIHWESYPTKRSGRQEMIEKITSFKDKNYPEAISLNTLKLLTIDVDGNNALVELEKVKIKNKGPEEENTNDFENQQPQPYFTKGQKIRLELLWDGSRWLITEDNVL